MLLRSRIWNQLIQLQRLLLHGLQRHLLPLLPLRSVTVAALGTTTLTATAVTTLTTLTASLTGPDGGRPLLEWRQLRR